MILASPILNPKPKFGGHFSKSLAISTNPLLRCCSFTTKFSSTLLNCHCGTHNKDTDKSTQGFSVLTSDIPWKTESLWSTMALYMFNLHIPLGFGGLSIVSYLLHQPVLDPQTEVLIYPFFYVLMLKIVIRDWSLFLSPLFLASFRIRQMLGAPASRDEVRFLMVHQMKVHSKLAFSSVNCAFNEALSLLVIDILELLATLFLLKSTIKPNNRLLDIFKVNPVERNWLLASALGFGVLILLVFLTSIVVDGLYGIKVSIFNFIAFTILLYQMTFIMDVNNLILKEMLVRSDISKGACITVYCIITPILEELVYRGFMLASLASTMNWKQAVVISAAIFSAAHLSGENFLQLFVIGCILGCSYCGTGNLSSSILIHSLYNAFTLIITFLS
ncbi:hypothetical protein Goshw_001552 [Gossypium schwendimanii]|uniref:CAAX prenyl protease 2/Lysostaphin resistance protein A-like domain-containing protein n=1 Tax=Gossypium schwendimanii TaxID=34291 RepID=A0A7J9MQJ6_GOSSC|nr:hypothetical protein [Gossypium schwendimanii]